MKSTLKYLLAVAIVFSASNTLWGVHVAGGEITYSYVPGKDVIKNGRQYYTYLVRFHFYRYCGGQSNFNNCPDVWFDPDGSPRGLSITNECDQAYDYPNQIVGVAPRVLKRVSCRQVTENCPDQPTICDGGRYYGVSEYVYEGEVELYACSKWTFSVQIDLRNSVSATIGLQSFYVETTLNNLVAPYNSSPTFSNDPIIQPMDGIPFEYNHGAVDNEGHELRFELLPPRSARNSYISYEGGYSWDKPFGTSVPFYFDGYSLGGNTGNFGGTAPGPMSTVMATKIEEYNQNGVLIGSVVRDIQINVLEVKNAPPTLSEINGNQGYTIEAYVGEELCFDIFSGDPNDHEVTLTSNVAEVFGGGATFIPTGTQVNPQGEFCWTPSGKEIGIYCFTVTAEDHPCAPTSTIPFPAQTSKSYCVKVIDRPCKECPVSFAPEPGKEYVLSAWVKEAAIGQDNLPGVTSYAGPQIILHFPILNTYLGPFTATGNIIDGWQRIEAAFIVPSAAQEMKITLANAGANEVYFDDIRIFPFNASMNSYAYDPITRRLMAELDENNYATFYEYDEEGALIRVKKETERGVMTIQESRNSTQKQN